MESTSGEQYLPVTEMPRVYPKFCETQCTAWNNHLGGCAGPVLGRHECKWSVSKITDRINRLKMMSSGPAWWKTSLAKIKSGGGDEDAGVMAAYE